MLALKSEWGAAGDQRLHFGCGAQDRAHQRRRIQYLLEVVEYQQQALGAEPLLEQRDDWNLRTSSDAERLGDGLGNTLCVAHGRQIHEPDTISIFRGQASRNPDRQAGLAGATWPGQRQQAMDGDQLLELADLFLAA